MAIVTSSTSRWGWSATEARWRLLIEAGKLEEAAELLHPAREAFVTHLGEDDYEVAVVEGNLATLALRRGDLAAAERRAQAALAEKGAAARTWSSRAGRNPDHARNHPPSAR